MRRNLLRFQEIKSGIQEVLLNIQELYPNQKEQEKFKERLSQFLKSDPYNSEIIRREDDLLIYRTECIIPEKRDSRFPLLLLLGNPASHSVCLEMFFSFESDGREHRFWKALKKASILEFKKEKSYAKDPAERNRSRKEELYDLGYKSDFRIGLATFYSMPSGASRSKWAGVKGLRNLFWNKALREIGECEKARVEEIIRKFLSPKGVVFAFQKDAYSEIKSSKSPDYDKARKEGLVGVCQCDHDVKLFCLPPTRLMQGKNSLALLRNFKEHVLKPL